MSAKFDGVVKMIKLLHISYDLRPKENLPVTTAVRDFIAETGKSAEVSVIDLVRVRNFNEERTCVEPNNHLNINSIGLPYGLLFIHTLNRTYKKIVNAVDEGLISITPSHIIHAHKVSFEGYIAYHLSIKYDTKLILTLRATDIWVFKNRPDLIHYFKPVFERSSKIIYLIPYIVEMVKLRLGDTFFKEHIKNKLEFLPNIIEREINPRIRLPNNGYYLTAMWMEKATVKRKNLKRLLKAIKVLDDPELQLMLIGDGKYLPKVKKWVKDLTLENNVNFKGYVPNKEMDKYYSAATAFLLPSLSESFGMVYAESLLNGTPIMYSKDCMGFDGVFENIGPGVKPYSVESIVDGIRDLIENHNTYRQRVKEFRSEGRFEIFSSEHITKKYLEIINSIYKSEKNEPVKLNL